MKQQSVSSTYQLSYYPTQTQGQCILKSVTPVKLLLIKYRLFCLLSIIMAGIPALLVYWYPILKLKIYFAYCHHSECTHFSIINYDKQISIVKKQEDQTKNIVQYQSPLQNNDSSKDIKSSYVQNTYFINRYMKYRLFTDEGEAVVRADTFNYQQGIAKIIKENLKQMKPVIGLSDEEVQDLRKRFGPGVMQIERPGLGVLFFRQVVRPLYFFIIFTLCVWTFEEYYYYCLVILFTTMIGIAINLYQTYTLNNKVYEMAYYETDVNVLRNGSVAKISSKNVVPGDIVFLHDPVKIPFDGIILEGSALLNECALTGQSVPVVRKAQDLSVIENVLEEFGKIPLKNNLICEGTTLIQVQNKRKMIMFEKYKKDYGIPVYVIYTNFVTLKGQLIRIISFPDQKVSIFEKQSSYFIIFLFCLSVFSYALLAIKLVSYIDPGDMVLKFLDLITITVPPSLPVSMTFGIIYAIDKMKKKNIYCVSPSKVIMGGLVNLICFDKTGTLTEDHMDFKSIVPAVEGKFHEPIENYLTSDRPQSGKQIERITKQNPFLVHILTNMASNHTIINVLSTGENVGDPMQIKLFQFGGYEFEDFIPHSDHDIHVSKDHENILFGFDNKRGHKGFVVKRMDFDSQLLRMSVVTKSSDSEYCLYSKGSPESIAKICDSSSLPENYHLILKHYASLGFRVLGIGHRVINKEEINNERTVLEQNLIFDGFEIFENRLKPETKCAITELKNAKIPCVMITGDNALTGSNISYKCKIVDINKKLYIFNYSQKQKQLTYEQFHYQKQHDDIESDIVSASSKSSEEPIELQQINNNDIELDDNGNQQKIINQQDLTKQSQVVINALAKIGSVLKNRKVEICLTGSAFNLLFAEVKLDEMDQQRKEILKSTKVYARAKPNDKTRIVMAYQQGLNRIVSMCGDGANDCGALKQSDAGLSLSQTQASISAPFTSKVTNISSMVELIKECRAGLVTNFSLFNIMALYSLIQYTSALICEYYFTYPSDLSQLYWDLFGNFFFFMTFGYTGTADKLSSRKPSRSLFTLTNLMQVGIMYLTQLLGQLLMIFSLSHFFAEELNFWEHGGQQNNYKAYVDNDNNFVTSSPETNILFLFANFMYIFSFLAFSISKPWRKQFYTNLPFMAVFSVSFTYSVLLVLVPELRISAFGIKYMNNSLVNLYILLTALIFGVFMYINQKFVLETISAKLRKKYPNKGWI